MKSKHQVGSTEYYLDLIRNDIAELLQIESEALKFIQDLRKEKAMEAQQQSDTLIEQILGCFIGVTLKPSILMEFCERLNDTRMSELAKALTIAQSIIHDETMDRLRKEAKENGNVADAVSVEVQHPL